MARGIIEVNNIGKTYANGIHAVQDISFRVVEGEFYGMLGPNGIRPKATNLKYKN